MTIKQTASQGAPALRIIARDATWTYELEAGGFSSLRDRDGAEWIGFAPGEPVVPGGAGNVFRGIPNLVFPDNIGHPGYRTCTSEWTLRGDTLIIRSRSRTPGWSWVWSIDESGASLHVEQAPADRHYWFLYEGTPGGRFEPGRAFWGTSEHGHRSDCPPLDAPATGAWDAVWFGDQSSPRVLGLAHITAACEPSLAGWMSAGGDDGMVVFGFGRSNENGVSAHLNGEHRFRVCFIDALQDTKIMTHIREGNDD